MTATTTTVEDNTDAPTPEKDTPSREQSVAREAWRVAREAWRLGKRWRLQLLPIAGIAATHGVGAAGASMDAPEALAPIALGWGATAGGYAYAHKRVDRWARVYAGIAAIGSAMFQAGLAFAGGTGLLAAMLWACGSALSLPWWVRHAEPDPDVTAEHAQYHASVQHTRRALPAAPTAGPVTVGENDPRQTLWKTNLGANGKRLAGSQLFDVRQIESGWTGVVELSIEHHWHEIIGAIKTITSVYDLPDGRVFPEPITGESVRRAKITVLERDPLEQVRHWPGPGLDERGSFPLMTPADGGEMLRYQLWNPHEGASHGLVAGGTRSGKSKILDVGLTECGMSRVVRPMIIDGGGGGSLVQWLDQVEECATNLTDAKELLRYLLNDLAPKRRPMLIEQGGGSIEPSEEHPLVALWFDEAHEFLMADKELVRLCERYAQQLAKYAFGLHLSTQVPSIEQLGGSNALRGQLKTGTIVALRITEGSNQSMIEVGAPLPERLKDLPAEFPDGKKTRGLGYVMTASRKIRSRAVLLENPKSYPMVDTPLEPALAAVPAPSMAKPGEESRSRAHQDADITRKVLDAISSGIAPSDILGITRETGCSINQIQQAVQKWDNGSADDAVAHALVNGCAKNPVAIMQSTGLSLRQAREALKNF